jgi:phosphoglycerate kinase
MAKLSIRDLSLQGRRCSSVDFNVPIKNGVIGDDTRVRASLPTHSVRARCGALSDLASHFGRPKGKPNMDYTLAPVAKHLSDVSVGRWCSHLTASAPRRNARSRGRQAGAVVLLENLRFHAEEEKNDAGFSKQLAASRRVRGRRLRRGAPAHASVDGMARLFERPAAGLLMEQELKYLGHALESPERPFVAILGGAKVSDKLEVIENLLGRVNA